MSYNSVYLDVGSVLEGEVVGGTCSGGEVVGGTCLGGQAARLQLTRRSAMTGGGTDRGRDGVHWCRGVGVDGHRGGTEGGRTRGAPTDESCNSDGRWGGSRNGDRRQAGSRARTRGTSTVSEARDAGSGSSQRRALAAAPSWMSLHGRAGCRPSRRKAALVAAERGAPAQGPRGVGALALLTAGNDGKAALQGGGGVVEGRAALPGGGGVVETAELACARDWNRFGAGLRRMRRLGWGSGRFGDGKG